MNENIRGRPGPTTPSGEQAVLNYAQAAREGDGARPARLFLELAGLKLILTVAAGYVLGGAARDADPFGPSWRQSFEYAVLAPSLIVACALWCGWSVVLIVRRRLSLGFAFAVVALALWAGVISLTMYQITAEFVEQTTRFHGASWPILEKIFRH